MSKLGNPTSAAQSWATRLAGATQAYTDGVNSVTIAPGQLAAAAKDRWLANTTSAANRYAANSAAVGLPAWQQQAITKGAPRLASGASAAQSKVEATFAKLFPAIQQAVNSLPARGTIDQNIERSAAFARAMNAKKGTFK